MLSGFERKVAHVPTIQRQGLWQLLLHGGRLAWSRGVLVWSPKLERRTVPLCGVDRKRQRNIIRRLHQEYLARNRPLHHQYSSRDAAAHQVSPRFPAIVPQAAAEALRSKLTYKSSAHHLNTEAIYYRQILQG